MKPIPTLRLALVTIIAATLTAADYPGLVQHPDTRPAQAIEQAAENHLDVAYLPDWRDTVTHGGIGNRQTTLRYMARMNIYVPPGEGPFPCFISVHGGGYGEGHGTTFGIWGEGAVDGRQVDPRALGMERGYVLVMLNYLLKNPFIQVQRDFKEAIRFLRAHSQDYHIDPNRIAAVGASAGGWLITSGGLTTADDYGYRSQASVPLAQWPEGWHQELKLARRKVPNILLSSFDELEPVHRQISARLNALVFDFSHNLNAITAEDPQMLSVAGSPEAWWERYRKGLEPEVLALWQEKITLIDYGVHNAEAMMQRGKLMDVLHVPPNNMLVPGLDGEPTTAGEYVFDWVDQTLRSDQALTPAAEARPNRRIFADTVPVTFATAAPDTRVHYTIDGSTPTTDSPLADGSLTLSDTTTVKFIAVADGLEPSPVATATFIKGEPPPRVTAPTEPTLPIATLGEPWEMQFTADRQAAWLFRLSGINNWRDKEIIEAESHAKLRELQARTDNLYQIGLDCDLDTGRVFGTPTQTGTFVMQVLTADDRGAPAECRTYTLVVVPTDSSSTEP